GVCCSRPERCYRITAPSERSDPPHQIPIPTVLGTVEPMQAPGRVRFAVRGKTFTLEPVIEDPNDPMLFFIFKDATSGDATYPSGRFLYAEMPKDGKVVLN